MYCNEVIFLLRVLSRLQKYAYHLLFPNFFKQKVNLIFVFLYFSIFWFMKKLNIAFFASHGGSNFQAIAENILSGHIAANAALLISNNSDSGAMQKAEKLGISHLHISSNQFDSSEQFQTALLKALADYDIDLIVLAGYMKKIPLSVIRKFPNRILNIHPALLPKYGGQGMYGMNVHQAVYENGETLTGATVHIVSEEYDEGKILKQMSVPIDSNDTPQSIADKVLAIEHKLYSEVIKEIINNTIKLD
jgi:phosphoribosylglycinamide formyltransferase-1